MIRGMSGGPVNKQEQLQVFLQIILSLNLALYIGPQECKEGSIHAFNKPILYRVIRSYLTLLH